ncbi:MAG: ATP-binding protein [Saprospiraceae bacterium]
MTKTSTQPFLLRLASDPANIAQVEQFVTHIVQRYRLNADQHGNLLISLTEAVNNAIIHGNCQDKRKKVSISLQERKNSLAIQVSDEGCGFDYQSVPDPTKEENLCKCGGRGVFLMHHLSDAIAFRNGGRTVEMRFNI